MHKNGQKDLAGLLWKNPVLRMQMRRRLRPRACIIWGLVTIIPCLFIFLNVYNSIQAFDEVNEGSRILAFKATFVPMLVVQGIILMFLGTGSVAGGIAEEKESGLLDYERLTPMSPAAKILGYLFGLPSREYLLCILTLPFTLISVIWGNISFLKVALLYTIFICAVLTYHLTAMVAGMLARRPRRASWFARILVVLLYVFLPNLSQMGLTVFGHLTILPTFWGLLQGELGQGMDFSPMLRIWETVPFFSWELPPALFTLLLMGFLMVVFVFILLRKWHQDTNHSMTKWFSIGVFAVLQVLMVGSLLPHVRGNLGMGIFIEQISVFEKDRIAAILFIYLVLSLAATILLIHLVTPLLHTHVKGLRRVAKLGLPGIPFNWDASTSLPCAMAFIVMTIAGYASLLAAGGQAGGLENTMQGFVLPTIVFAALVFYIQATRTLWPTAGFFGFLALFWLVPQVTGLTLSAFTGESEPTMYLGLCSPIQAFFNVIALPLDVMKPYGSDEHSKTLPMLAGLSITLHGTLAVIFVLRASSKRRLLRELETRGMSALTASSDNQGLDTDD